MSQGAATNPAPSGRPTLLAILDGEGRIRVNADGTISVAWWLRDESGALQPWMRNSFTRTNGEPASQ